MKKIRVGINGLGRIGRLVLRAAYDWPEFEFVRVNEVAGDAVTMAHLLTYDSIQGTWKYQVEAGLDKLVINGQNIVFTSNKAIADTDWSDCDLVIEATGVHKSTELLTQYLRQGVKRVVVSAPVKEPDVLNLVMGVNDHLFDAGRHRLVTAASCTTNCIAPVVKVIHENLGIRHGSITTVHDITNTQSILDQPHKDLRRARAGFMSLIPTTTGSAKAITDIFPELKGKLNGHAIRVPLANASITDCVFELEKETDIQQVNMLLKQAADGELAGILGYEEKPLVSMDYKGDTRSGIVDALSTMVVNKTQLKLYVWYDNEMGYSVRTAELAKKVGLADITAG